MSNRPRPDRKVERQREGAERNKAWAGLSAVQKLASLDQRLGVGVGAKRQRKLLGGN